MAFTQPRTWVSGEVPTAVLLNAQIRDNNNELALHAHTGGSGSGSSALGGTIGLTHIDLRDAAAPTGAGGTITRLYSSGSQVGRVEPGGTAAIFATSLHEHSVTQASATGGNYGSAATMPGTFAIGSSMGPMGIRTVSVAHTVGGSGSQAVSVAGVMVASVYEASGSIWVERDGTLLGTVSNWTGTASGGTIHAMITVVTQAIDTARPSGSATYSAKIVPMSLAASGSMGNYITQAVVSAVEIQQQ